MVTVLSMAKFVSIPNFNKSDACKDPVQINWNACVLCQHEKEERLVYPDGRKNTSSGYETLAQNITQFHGIDAMPLDIDIAQLNDGSGISQTLQNNHAGWHKSCWLLFCTMKLQRAQTRAQKRKQEIDDHLSPVKTRHSVGNPCNVKGVPDKHLCFLCEQNDEKGPLHCASTANIDATVRECATELRDTKLLAKLAAGDMIAIDAFYHLSCLTKLRNRMRDHKTNFDKEPIGVSEDALVFGELVGYIEELRQNEAIIPVFKLSELVKMYSTRLAELDPNDKTSVRIHSTRLKERLLSQIPDLRAEPQGRDVLLIFKRDIGGAIKQALGTNMDTDAMALVRASQVVRKGIFDHKYEFTGSFENGCEIRAVPPSLNALVRMILEGPNIESQSHANTTKDHIATCISELIMFNTVQRSRASASIRHNRERETPLPIYLSMLIHAKTRKRELIDTLFNLGLCVSYDRLMHISTDLANTVCAQYHAQQVVCPPQLRSNVFTCGAVDNIDHNPSARTAYDSFHGTAISLMQFPTTGLQGENQGQLRFDPIVIDQNKIAPLPLCYTMVPPVAKTRDPIAPLKCGVLEADPSIISEDMAKEYDWLQQVRTLMNKAELEIEDYMSWSAYHASQQLPLTKCTSHIALLPLFRENAHTACMISHAMQMIMKATHHLNPTQTPVVVADQPLYAIAKQVQWSWPGTHGENKVVVMMGGLHIEMNLLKLLGDWQRGSGWAASLVQAGITTSGRADAILSGSHVTRARYAHQVTAASLRILQERAYQLHITRMPMGQSTLSFEQWSLVQCTEQPQFKYWATTLQLELMMLQFVRSIRESNFKMYVQCLLQIAPWLFALDHTNYARWLPVHISDMVNLEVTHPDVYREFMKGNFVAQKTQNAFSAMAMDQCHEQVNELIKGDGGAVGLTENPQALERWMVAGPEISRAVVEYENSLLSLKEHSTKHHEQYPAIQKTFAKDVSSLVSTIENMGNPFLEDSGEMLTLDTKNIASKDVVQAIYKSAEDIGKRQYSSFVVKRLQSTPNTPLSDIVSKNKLPLLSIPHAKQQPKGKVQVDSLKKNCALFSRLYIACQARQGNLDSFFEHENQAYPPSLSDNGDLYLGTKSDILEPLGKLSPSSLNAPDVDAKVLDGAAITHMLKPGACRTFQDYAMQVFMPYITRQLESVSRVDIIWDRYFPDSLKKTTREHRIQNKPTQRQRVLSGSPIPANWDAFLRHEKNKDELFHYLADCTQAYDTGEKVLISTLDQSVVIAGQTVVENLEGLQPCTHEEADTRILLHVAHCVSQGLTRVAIRTVDSDVVVLAIGHFHAIRIDELWVTFGLGTHVRHIPIHTIAGQLLHVKARALLFFHAVSGCDTVSSFTGRGKKTAWSAWDVCPSVTDAFSTLSSQPIEVEPSAFHEIERFVVIMYSKTCELSRVNEARRQLFTQESRTMENIPPTKAALLQHIKRAVYQSGYVWSQALVPSPDLPSPGNWGWAATDSGWKPLWTELAQASLSCYELVRCGCKKGCKPPCKCRAASLQCTELCYCSGACAGSG